MISGGGTGGHIFPAIAIARALEQKVKDIDILFVGAEGRMEMERVPEAGYKIEGLPISGIQRKLSLKNLLVPFKLLKSLLKADSILRRFKPHAAIGVGGYASGPTLYRAKKRKIPTLIQEQNSYAGITNKILAQRANKICVAYDNMERYFPKDKIVVTGNPVRESIAHLTASKEEACSYFEINSSKKTILAIGGSLGARTINISLDKGLKNISDAGYQLIWQTGKLYYEEAERRTQECGELIKAYKFISRMDYAYAAADVIISRAGALSISELALVKKPVILIPSPNVAEDHQTKNAMALVNKHAAIMIKDSEAEEKLVDKVLALMQDEGKQRSLRENIAVLGIPDAADRIAEEVLNLVK